MSELVMLACSAMRCRFEVVLYGDDPVRLRAAGEEAIKEILETEKLLSRFLPGSDISRVNSQAHRMPVRVDPRTFAVLKHAAALSEETRGAFDPTVGPLMACWGFREEPVSAAPSSAEIEEALRLVGMRHLELDDENSTIRFLRPGMSLDMGAFGKGVAIDRAVRILREAGIKSAFVHGGTSTAYGLGSPPNTEGWSTAVRHPLKPDEQLYTFTLKNSALSVSAPHGRTVMLDGRTYGHVVDPRSGRPVEGALLAAATAESAADAEAFSTAALVLNSSCLEELASRRPGLELLVVRRQNNSADGTDMRIFKK